MNSGAIGLILTVGFSYFILTVIMPAIFFYRYIRERRFVVRFAIYQVTGNAYIILWGFLFSFLKIWSVELALLVFLFLPLLAKLLIFRRDLISLLLDYVRDKRNKVVTTRGTLKNIRLWAGRKLKEAYFRYIRYHYAEILFLFALFVFAVWYYGYFKMHYFTYASSDEATHLYWVNTLFAGYPFPVGMYPHSMHFMMAAIHSICGIQTLLINHYFSVTIMLMVHFMIFCAVKALFRSGPAALASTGLYLFADLFIAQRYHNTLPMEYGMIAMLVMIIFMNEFIKNRDKVNMWLAALATGWTFHSHFYITFFSVFLWAAFLLVYLKTIIRLKAVLRTLLVLGLSVVIALAPFGVGLLAGLRFEQSIDWGLRIMGAGPKQEDVEVPTAESRKKAEEEGELVQVFVSEAVPEKELTAQQIEFRDAKTPNDYLRASEHLLTMRLVKNEDSALYVFLAMGFAFLYGIGEIIARQIIFLKKKKEILAQGSSKKIYRRRKQEFLVQNGLLLAVPLMAVFGTFCYVMSYFGLPELIDDSRAAMILSPLLALLIAFPIRFVQDLVELIPVKKKWRLEFVLLLLVGAGLGAYYQKGPVKQLNTINCYAVTMEPSNKLSYDLIGTHPRNTWTVISPVNDLLAIHHYGYHYEVIDLLMEIENGEKDIAMPTNDLYIVVEKRVMNQSGVYYLPDYHGQLVEQTRDIDETMIDLNYYDLGLPWRSPDEAYSTFRQVTMTKLYYWMEEMKKAYPNEVELYDEDDITEVWHIRQSADFPINLARDYRRETYGVDARDDFERRYAEKHGTEYEGDIP